MFANESITQSPIRVYYLYAANERDEELCRGLMQHLAIFEGTGRTLSWHAGDVLAGGVFARESHLHLEQAQLILLLVSAAFIASSRKYDTEMMLALERHARGEAYVVPILLRPGYYKGAAFDHLKVLPDNGLPLICWNDLDSAYTNIAYGLAHILECLVKKQVVDFVAPTLAQPRAKPHRRTYEQMGRQHMLRRVHDFWIRGLLERTPQNFIPIDLELREQFDALANPLCPFIQEMSSSERTFSPGTHIIDICDEADGELLILGEPGTGKTTLLLELARELLKRAALDEDYPLPVIFPLASWTTSCSPFSSWLIKELQGFYKISSKLARELIDTQRIFLLLDGLDEVEPATCSVCINALNDYHLQYESVPIVITCRKSVYFSQKERFTLNFAISIQELTERQIEIYVSNTSNMADLRAMLTPNGELRSLIITPLWLTIVTQVSRDRVDEDLKKRGVISETLQQRLFALYVESVQARHKVSSYTPAETERFLAWLAWQMRLHNQRRFYLDYIQPDWLTGSWLLTVYYICMSCIGIGILALTLGLAVALVNGPLWGWIPVSLGALIGGAGFAFASAKIRPIEVAGISSVKGRVLSLIFSIGLWLFILFQSQGNSLLHIVITIAIILSLVPLFIGELLKDRSEARLIPSHRVAPDDGLRRSRQNGLWIGLCCGSGMALIVALLHLVGLLKENIAIAWSLALVVGLFSGLVFGGLAAIQLSIVRRALRIRGVVPGKYVHFLDYATERMLLHKVGGGYIFLHPLLQDYFVSRYQDRHFY